VRLGRFGFGPPVFVVVCGDQEFWIEGSRRPREGIAVSSFDRVPVAGRAIALERPAELNAVLDRFLASFG
jgi:hypothetical protein